MVTGLIQSTVSNLLNGITNGNPGLNSYFSNDFKGTLYGWMDGEKSEVTVGKEEMILMSRTIGASIKAVVSLTFRYFLGRDQEDELVYIVNYKQRLVFEPTALLTPEEQQLARMLSRGIQVYRWIINEEGKAEITNMLSYEVDKTQPIKDMSKMLETIGTIKQMFSMENFQKAIAALDIADVDSVPSPFFLSSSTIPWEKLRADLLEEEKNVEIELPLKKEPVEIECPQEEKKTLFAKSCAIA